MARKKKRAGSESLETAATVIEEGSKEAVEAAATLDKTQQAEMADLLDDSIAPEAAEPAETPPAEAAPEQKPPEKPAESEPVSPPEKAKEPEPDLTTGTEEQPPGETPKPEATVPDSKPKKEPDFVSGDRFEDFTVEVVSDDGARSVPLGNLVTTYQQFGHLQRKYQEVKPLFDLVEKAGYKPIDTLPLVELGIQAYIKQQGIVDGRQPPVSDTRPPAPGEYQGPFKDAEQDAYFLEVDPDHHASMHRLFDMASGGGKVAQIEAEIENLKRARSAPLPPEADPNVQAKMAEAQQAFEGKIKTWSGDHTDYFTAPNIGEARLNAFRNFIIRSHAKSGLKIKDLTPDFLSAEFARFDSRYNLEYMKRLASKKAADGKEESGMFAEGTGVRTQAEPLDEQQKHMVDLL